MFNLKKEKNEKKICFSNENKYLNSKSEKVIEEYNKYPSLSKGIEIIKNNGINLEQLHKIVKIIEILDKKNISNLITTRENNKNFDKKLITNLNYNNLNENKIEECKKIKPFILNENTKKPLDIIYFPIEKLEKINNPQIPKDYLNLIYKNLLLEEKNTSMRIINFLKNQNEINSNIRSILIDWIIDVHLKFKLKEETLYMIIFIIDKYLSIEIISKNKFQLLGISSILIACKHEEIDVPKINELIYITDNSYSKKDVIYMENEILKKLNFSLLYPSPLIFFELISLYLNFDKTKILMGKYLMESFLIDEKFVKYKSSIISCACAYVVMKFFKMENYQESYNKKWFLIDDENNMNENYIKECARDICIFVDNINKTIFQSTYRKFSKEKFHKVSTMVLGK